MDAGLVTGEQLEAALAEQGQTGQRLGEILVARGHVSGPAIANALADQYGGVVKTEYGFATGLGSRAAAAPAAPDAPARPDLAEQVDNLLRALDARERTIEELRAALRGREGELAQLREPRDDDHEPVRESAPPAAHLLFVPLPTGYMLLEGQGDLPAVGSQLELEDAEGRFVISKLGRSPLPHDERRCVFLQPA